MLCGKLWQKPMDNFLGKINSHQERFACSFGPENSKTSKKDPL